MRKIIVPLLVIAVLFSVGRTVGNGGNASLFSWLSTSMEERVEMESVAETTASSAGWLDWIWQMVAPAEPVPTPSDNANCVGINPLGGDQTRITQGQVCCRGLVMSTNAEGEKMCRKPLTIEEGCMLPSPFSGGDTIIEPHQYCCPDVVSTVNAQGSQVCRTATASSSQTSCISDGQERPFGTECCPGLNIEETETHLICRSPYTLGTISSTPTVPPETCEVRTVNGIIKRCCKVKYSAFDDCKTFSYTFNELCKEAGLKDCKQIGIDCDLEGIHHAMNTATIDGKTCLVEPQGRIVGCTPPKTLQDIVCEDNGLKPGCDCRITDIGTLGPILNSFGYCATYPVSDPGLVTCNACCDSSSHKNDPGFLAACKNACAQRDGASTCRVANNCRAGYAGIGLCDRVTCLTPYNTGLCKADQSCAIIMTRCERPATQCDNPPQAPSPISIPMGTSAMPPTPVPTPMLIPPTTPLAPAMPLIRVPTPTLIPSTMP